VLGVSASEFIHIHWLTADVLVVVNKKHWLDTPVSSSLTPLLLPVLVVSGTLTRTHTRYCAVSGAVIVVVAEPMTDVDEQTPGAACEANKLIKPIPAKTNINTAGPTIFFLRDVTMIFWIFFLMCSLLFFILFIDSV
jgi:hypothetical protein